MVLPIRWITAIYRVTEGESEELRTHIGVPESGRDELQRMLDTATVSEVLVALYLPKSTPKEYEPGPRSGKVVGIAKVKSLPRRKRVEDFGYPDTGGDMKWPIGFPCEVIYYPGESDCPSLEDLVKLSGDITRVSDYRRGVHRGPVRLSRLLQDTISDHFERLERVSTQ